ncbi:hypothetical protein DFS34DRAFT_435585 [Phlyctochytrium arcticum]|nr:hypothetical protein DFS34DRAFT_435585 [Phlyctochytrium arcticum]
MAANTNTSAPTTTSTTTTGAPSLIHGHLQYVKGAAESTLGSLTSSAALNSAGASDKAQAIAELRAADSTSDQRHATNQQKGSTLGVEGKVEEYVGRISGCGGMIRDGEEKRMDAAGRGDNYHPKST